MSPVLSGLLIRSRLGEVLRLPKNKFPANVRSIMQLNHSDRPEPRQPGLVWTRLEMMALNKRLLGAAEPSGSVIAATCGVRSVHVAPLIPRSRSRALHRPNFQQTTLTRRPICLSETEAKHRFRSLAMIYRLPSGPFLFGYVSPND